MRVSTHIREAAAAESGGVLVMVALWLPLLVLMLTFVIDVANWFEHKRHLQMQADAAALAAARDFRIPCDNAPIQAAAAAYAGDTYNAQIGGTPAGRVFRRINSKTFYNQPASPDDTVEAPPCQAAMVDVKLTEVDVPWLIGALGAAVPAVKRINARARVAINQLETTNGALPLGVPDTNPKAARAYFINEDTGATIGSIALTKVGTSNGLAVWDNAAAPLPVTFASDAVRVGVVVALSGGTSTTCGQPLVTCYDAGVATQANGMPSKGILYIRGWSNAGTHLQSAGNDPILRQAQLVTGTCSDPYFSAPTTSCTVGLQARADFGTVGGVDQTTVVGATLTATVGGQSYPLTYNTTTKVWATQLTIPVAANAGPLPVTVDWAETKGTWKGNTCKTGNGNKCAGSFGVVQRAFGASDPRSGPIKAMTVSENGVQWANSLERCSSVQTSCTHNLVVRIGVKGSLGNATSVNDPVVALRVIGGSQNQSLDCDPNISQLKGELSSGCGPTYGINRGTACPSSPSSLWSTAQPWHCVALQTGSATNQVPAGMNLRILGSEKPNSCTAPNHWSQYPNLPADDPRFLEVFLTPFGSFSGSGTNTVPVTDFARFYITGWTASGGGFANPCQGNGDDPVPNNDPGTIVGHFVKYIANVSSGTGTTPCDLSAFGSCVGVLTR
jgi:Flp pilus assembly protein TadG